MANQLDKDLILRMIAQAGENPVQAPDQNVPIQGFVKGSELANTLLTRRQAQEDRERKLAQEIEKIKRQKQLATEARTAAPKANISPDLAEAATLEAPDEASKQIAQSLFGEPKKEPRPFGFQEKGRLRTGEAVSFDPNTNQTIVESRKGRMLYDPSLHGEIQPNVSPQLTPEQIKDISSLRDNITQLEQARQNYKPTLTGPIESRLIGLYNATGINLTNVDPTDATRFRIGATTALNDYIRQTTGAQLSANEERRISAAMANVKGPDETFIPAIEEAIKIAERKLQGRFADYEALGYRNLSALKKSREGMAKPAESANQIDAIAGALGLKKKAPAGGQ